MVLKKERAKYLKSIGYSIREIMKIMGYKSPRSIQQLLNKNDDMKTPQMKNMPEPPKPNRKQCKQTAVFFASEMVYKALNPNSKMNTPNSVYEKIDKEFDKWIFNYNTQPHE